MNRQRRLTLRRETVRRLTGDESARVAGGSVTLPICPSMWTCPLGGCPTITVCPQPIPGDKSVGDCPRDVLTIA